jgi:hypothetical protein
VSLHGKKRLGKKDRKGWRCDKILAHLKKFAPRIKTYKNHVIKKKLIKKIIY